MGKLTIRGKASMNCTYDIVTLEIEFYKDGNTANAAMDAVLTQCESFLSYLDNQGVPIDQIAMEQDEVERHYDEDNEEYYYTASRKIVIRMSFDMPFINMILDHVRQQNYDIAIESSYKLSNEREIHDELIKQAVANSKHRAEAIAATVGKKIIGIKSVSMNNYSEDSIRYCDMLAPDSLRYEKPKSLDLSNQLAANSTTESESVDVEWIID